MDIELLHVTIGYDKVPVYENINFKVSTGQICCILGPNGVGKTTLFRSILRFMPVLEGSILVGGHDVRELGPSQMAKYMAYVAQSHVPPFSYLVKDVVLLGRVNSTSYFSQPKKQDYEIVENAMESLGIRHLRDRVYTDLSGGERQLVMIARGLAQQPQFLILDEPTASLDYGNSVMVLKQIKHLTELGLGVIMTTHNPDHTFLCDSQVALLSRTAPLIYGDAIDVVTEKNMKEAYGINVEVIEYVNHKGERMRLCSPEM